MGKKETGRPFLLTEAIERKICDAIASGLPNSHAAALVGINRKTLQRWRSEGERDLEDGNDSVLSRFFTAMEHARAVKVQEGIAQLKKHATEDPRVMMWLLERTEPREFGAMQKIELETNVKADPRSELGDLINGLASRDAPEAPVDESK